MSTTIPSPATTPSLIADYFEAAATHADNNKKVSYSDIKTLLKKVTNSSEKLTPKNYQRVQTATGKLNSILENQKSNVTEKKERKIHEVFCKAFDKIPDIYVQEIKDKATQGTNTPHTPELTTKAKTVRQENVIDLMKTTQSIKGKIDIFINDQNKPTYWWPSEKQYLELKHDLLILRNYIDKSRNSILSSSYQHNPSKLKMLTRLDHELTQHQEKLDNQYKQNEKTLGRNIDLEKQTNEDNYVKNQGFQPAIKNEDS